MSTSTELRCEHIQEKLVTCKQLGVHIYILNKVYFQVFGALHCA